MFSLRFSYPILLNYALLILASTKTNAEISIICPGAIHSKEVLTTKACCDVLQAINESLFNKPISQFNTELPPACHDVNKLTEVIDGFTLHCGKADLDCNFGDADNEDTSQYEPTARHIFTKFQNAGFLPQCLSLQPLQSVEGLCKHRLCEGVSGENVFTSNRCCATLETAKPLVKGLTDIHNSDSSTITKIKQIQQICNAPEDTIGTFVTSYYETCGAAEQQSSCRSNPWLEKDGKLSHDPATRKYSNFIFFFGIGAGVSVAIVCSILYCCICSSCHHYHSKEAGVKQMDDETEGVKERQKKKSENAEKEKEKKKGDKIESGKAVTRSNPVASHASAHSVQLALYTSGIDTVVK